MFDRPTFSRSEVILRTNQQTNKQTPLNTSTSLRYATPVGNKHYRPYNVSDRVIAMTANVNDPTSSICGAKASSDGGRQISLYYGAAALDVISTV